MFLVLSIDCFSLYLRTCHLAVGRRRSLLSDVLIVIWMRASLSKSDNALSSVTNANASRLKRHHSIDDDCPMMPSVAAPTALPVSIDEKEIRVHFHPDLVSFDHRVPLLNGNTDVVPVQMQTSSFSSELMVRSSSCIGILIFVSLSLESCAMVFSSRWSTKRSSPTWINRKWRNLRQRWLLIDTLFLNFRLLVPVLNGISCRFSSRIIGIGTVQQTVQIHWLNCRLIFLFIFSPYSIQVGSSTFHVVVQHLLSSPSVSLARCTRVNKLWYYLCSHPELWHQLAQQKKWSFSSLPLDQQQIESYTDEHGKSQVTLRSRTTWRMSDFGGSFLVEIHLYRTISSSISLVKWKMWCEDLSRTHRR